ncbi:sulfurtransferase [Kaistella jeonii]|uniref:Sulfurtransferase n=1 Tax=Kaistella jeonii TaxID=266749 RepID=A0A0C1D7U2_9FLAO|nr:sulfurtransferase [Kaistella jeonii]KIA89960.1 sulfurtransferase [Kaistella jeonii]SFB80292.1 thiosulfate/3-mercaptopyruvate sulfurtransferase [Kaistella jeonii]VEI96216.1 3-mercaptopyruvate sulfurtransferase [Kaistella jeonii]
MKLPPIISAKEFQNLNREDLVIVDAGSGDSAYENYLKEHLEGALYVDLNKDLAEIPQHAKNGGRHPLPSLEKFAEVLYRLGIDENSHVIVYDDKNASNAAARFWWMLRSAGIEKIQVLNGGLQMAKEKGLSTNSEIIEAKKVEKISLKKWKLPKVDLDFIEKNSENAEFLVIDVREKDRYDGKSEPIDEIAGHIPGAINVTFKENLNEDGTFKNPEMLREKYVKLLKNIPSEKIAIHCGSGVTACHTLLALDYAGFEIPNLYVGSWSEWSRNDKEIATNI